MGEAPPHPSTKMLKGIDESASLDPSYMIA